MGFVCCGAKINKIELWILKDIQNFNSRKLTIAHCDKCHKIQLVLIEKRSSDGKVFTNIIDEKNVANVLLREKNRLLYRYYDIENDSLFGWIYGVNIEIKNKKGKTTQIRQYSSDFNGNKVIQKKINIK